MEESQALSQPRLQNEKLSRGGGRQHLLERYAERAEEYSGGHKSEQEDKKFAKGHHTKENQSKEYDVEDGDASRHAADDAFYLKHGGVVKGEKGRKVSTTNSFFL